MTENVTGRTEFQCSYLNSRIGEVHYKTVGPGKRCYKPTPVKYLLFNGIQKQDLRWRCTRESGHTGPHLTSIADAYTRAFWYTDSSEI